MSQPPRGDSAASDSGAAIASIRAHLAQGAPWDACDAFRDAVANQPHDAELLYCGALAHARAGATSIAHALLDRAQAVAEPGSPRMADVLSLRGRLWKDRLHRASAAAAAEHAARARSEYLAAYALNGDPYPGINAATLSLVLGDRAEACRIAREIGERLAASAAASTYWEHATAGEAALILGEHARARQCYAAACAGARGEAGSIASMRRQIHLLARALPAALQVLPELPAPAIVAFAGHMIDTPERREPRFPAALEPAVAAALRAQLGSLHEPIFYTSAACGADLILIEVAFAIGAEVNIVLPFARDDFIRTSVAIGGDHWVRRFEAALARATRVIPATTESYLGDDVLFEHAALLIEGLALLRASQLETSPALLCVVDTEAPGGVGGTRASAQRWRRRYGEPHTIDLGALRAGLSPHPPLPSRIEATPRYDAAPPASPADATSAARALHSPDERPRRTLKSLLFADFAGYSRLDDAILPLFQSHFLHVASAEIESMRVRPLAANSWGDALYVVFESTADGVEFALRFLARMQEIDWPSAGLPTGAQVRIALHSGPVFCCFDPIMGRDNYFGSNVTRTARIEPVTPPGTVYASEAFAATLAATGDDEYTIEYVGVLPLAKSYGAARIYRLDRH